jgi:hypothetical protein
VILLTLLCEILPKHHQLYALCPKASRNTFQALVDPPHDRNNLSLDAGDDRTDGSNDNTIVNIPPHDSSLPASPNYQNNATAISLILQTLICTLVNTQGYEARLAEEVWLIINKTEYNIAKIEAVCSSTSDYNTSQLDILNSKIDIA